MFKSYYHCSPDTSERLFDLHRVNKQCRRLGIAGEEGEAGMNKSHRVWDTQGCSNDKHTTRRRFAQLSPCTRDMLFPAHATAGMKAAEQEMPSCSFSLPSLAHEFCVLSHLFLGHTRSMWLRNEHAAGCPVVETPQAESSESQGKVITKASINYFHHCLKPDDTSTAASSWAPHCQLHTKARGSSYLLVLGLLPFCTLTDMSLTLGLSLSLCGISPGASSFKFCLLWFYTVNLWECGWLPPPWTSVLSDLLRVW